MGGLLYKDFVVTCRLKRINIVWIFIGATIIFFLLRALFSGTGVDDDFLVTNENGEAINLFDTMFIMILASFIISCVSLSNSFVSKIIEGDEKNKIKGYLRVMPLGKHDYIASKYIYMGIVCYVLFSFEIIWSLICTAYCLEGRMKDLAQLLTNSCSTLTCLGIFMAGFELPLFLNFGKEKAMYGKIVFGIVIGLLLIGYILFGDLSIFENLDIYKIVEWCNNHETELLVLSTLSPVFVMALYYGSYKLSCKLADRKEM